MTSVELNKNNKTLLEKDWNAPQCHRLLTVYIISIMLASIFANLCDIVTF